jgi:hypothetical protein
MSWDRPDRDVFPKDATAMTATPDRLAVPEAQAAWVRPVRRRLPIVLYAVAVTVCAGVVAAGLRVEPDARGFGSHRQLGLPACTLPDLTGYPCPTCGLTTSWAWMARGQVVQAVSAHLLGALLYAAAAALLVWTVAASVMRRSPLGAMRILASFWVWMGVIALVYVSWLCNIVAVVAGLKTYS